ncbi:MAG: molecular chaperone HtpG [Stappiaceae bacterium]
MSDTASKETFSFQTEVGRLLDIVAGSLYSNREIFLRELVSNASDACDKLRHDALTTPALAQDDPNFRIELSLDAKAKTVTIADNGIGMNRDDLLETLGTIARSGTSAFLDKLATEDKNDLGLIGQFGVGFYSAFMVADRVEVVTRRAGEEAAWLWDSDGKGEFSIEAATREQRGTTVTLHIKKDAKEFLEKERLSYIIKTYSDHISFPIMLGEETLNAASALWTRSAKDISEQQYTEFYRHTAHAFDEPWLTLHNQVEGLTSYTNLLFVPTVPPFDLYEPERKNHVKLYVNRVFITEDTKGLLPMYLRFLRGIVDSEDLSLNISREMLQTDPKLAKIRTGLTKKVLTELKKKANKDPESYAAFWNTFGAVLKEGLVEDDGLRDRILEVCRFSSTNDEKLTSLSGYVERLKEDQEAIYYITGTDPSKIVLSPHLEGFRAKGVEVLLLSDPVDEFWLQHITEFDGKALKSITRGAADLDAIKSKDSEEDDKEPEAPASIDGLIAAFKLELGEAVKDVRPSKRLTDSAVCLIADDGDMDVNLERLLQQHGQLKGGGLTRVLELNPKHSIVKKLAERAEKEGAATDSLLQDAAHLLLDQARIADGEVPKDPAEFGRRLSAVMENAL